MKKINKLLWMFLYIVFTMYLNAQTEWDTPVYYTLDETLGDGRDTQNNDNEWMSNDEKDLKGEIKTTIITHILIHPKDDIEIKDDTRMPLIIVHGVDGESKDADPLYKGGARINEDDRKIGTLSQSIENQLYFLTDERDGYFENLHQLLKRSDLSSKFRVYYYSYASQKHITYNARKLSNLLGKDKYIMDWINKGGKITFLAHSMGGLVTRSMLEEHKGISYYDNGWKLKNTEDFLGGLITLGTPHHGSPTAISKWFDLGETAPISWYAPKTDYPGYQDLFWDNYDGVLFHSGVIGDIMLSTIHFKDYDCSKLKKYNAINVFDKIRSTRDEAQTFDGFQKYNIKEKCFHIDNALFYKYNIPLQPNPWLSNLNAILDMKNDAYQAKYYFYGGINDEDNKHVSNIVNDESLANASTTYLLFKSGYYSDYIVPTSSSTYDKRYKLKDIDNLSVFNDKYGKSSGEIWLRDFILENKDTYFYINNNLSPKIRFFKDYHHTRMKSGGYYSKKYDLNRYDILVDSNTREIMHHGIEDNNKLVKYISEIIPLDTSDLTKYLTKSLNIKFTSLNAFEREPYIKQKLYFDPLYLQISKDLKKIYCKSQSNSCNSIKDNDKWYIKYVNLLNTTLKDNHYDKSVGDKITRGKFLRLALVAFGIASDGLTDIQYRDIARKIGIIKNEGDGRLDDLIQKDESAKIIVLLSKLKIEAGVISENIKVDMSNFDDYEDLKNSWYFSEGYFLPAYDEGIVEGASNNGKKRLELLKNINYAEAIKMISVATCSKWCSKKNTNCSPDVLMECISSSIGGKK